MRVLGLQPGSSRPFDALGRGGQGLFAKKVGSVASAVAPSFDPNSIAGLVMWKKASSLALNDNDPVSSWPNLGSAGGTFDSTLTARPLYKANQQNGYAGVQADGINDRLTGTASFAGVVGTYFAVVKNVGSTAAYLLNANYPTGTQAVISNYTVGSWEYYSTPRTTIATVSTTVFKVIIARGYAFGTGTPSFVHFTDNASYWGGIVLEDGLYDTDIGATNEAALLAGLKAKYGI